MSPAVTSPFFPRTAPVDVQLQWAVRARDNARRRELAWGKRHQSMYALVRRLRRSAAMPDVPYYEYEGDTDEVD